jgi:enamine deaminase RidA (YjgF/YER057c/UK114 family)
MSFDHKLAELGIALPAPPKPVATYIPAVLAGDLLFLSGMIPFRNGKLAMEGKLGKELTVEQGYEAARLALLNALAAVRQQVGALDRVRRIVRLVGYVASAEGFTQQPAVINGASDLLVSIFGEAGRHARIALGAAELPLNAPVEIELILQIIAGSDHPKPGLP